MKGSAWVIAGFIVSAVLTASCQQGSAQPPRSGGVVRVATYNLQWFSESANPARIKNIKSVLGKLAPDIVGLQEIESEKALRQVFDGSWELGIADDPASYQELAIAVRRPYMLVSAQLLFDSPNLDDAFPEARDVLRAVIQTPTSRQLVVYVVHMKSRLGGRQSTDWQREMAAGFLATYIRGKSQEPNVVVLGDFNDAPDDVSLNILESGDLNSRAGKNPRNTVLVNLCDPLADKDVTTEGVYKLFSGSELSPVVRGSRDENGRLRGKNYEFPADVNIQQTLFDQILVGPQLVSNQTRAVVYCGPEALRGKPGRTRKDGSRAVYIEKGDLASDHLPVYADITPR